VIWAVSTNGQIYNTTDHGKVWTNVTNIAALPPHTHFNTIDAGDDVGTAYVAGRIRGERGETVPDNEDADVPLMRPADLTPQKAQPPGQRNAEKAEASAEKAGAHSATVTVQ
jgi:hypothetical protein